MNIITKAERLRAKTGSISGSAKILGIPKSTLSRWLRNKKPNAPKCEPKCEPLTTTNQQFIWCTNIGHETAHLVDPVTGKVACGIDIGRFNRWTIEPDPIRKCLRCPANA